MAGRQDHLIDTATERAALVPVKASPDAPLIGGSRVLTAVHLDRAVGADPPGLDARIAVSGEEDARVLACADRPFRPGAGEIGGTSGSATGSRRTGALALMVSSGIRDRSIGRGTGERAPGAGMSQR